MQRRRERERAGVVGARDVLEQHLHGGVHHVHEQSHREDVRDADDARGQAYGQQGQKRRVRGEGDGQRAQPEASGNPARQQVRSHACRAEQQQHEARSRGIESDDVGEDGGEVGVEHVGGRRAGEDHGDVGQHTAVGEQAQLRAEGGSCAFRVRGGAGERRQQDGAHRQAQREHARVGGLPVEQVGQRRSDGHADDARHREARQHEPQHGGHALRLDDVWHVGEREGQKRAGRDGGQHARDEQQRIAVGEQGEQVSGVEHHQQRRHHLEAVGARRGERYDGRGDGAGQRVVAHEIADERERLAQPFGHVGRDAYQHELGEPEREREGRQQRGCERVALAACAVFGVHGSLQQR